jgi:hypothetical protein
MRVSLTIVERQALMGLLPQRGSFYEMTLAREVSEAVRYTTAELEALPGFQPLSDGSVRWDADKEVAVEFEFTASQAELVRRRLRELDKQCQLEVAHLGLWKKFGVQDQGG